MKKLSNKLNSEFHNVLWDELNSELDLTLRNKLNQEVHSRDSIELYIDLNRELKKHIEVIII